MKRWQQDGFTSAGTKKKAARAAFFFQTDHQPISAEIIPL
jgi:hypothetical protein